MKRNYLKDFSWSFKSHIFKPLGLMVLGLIMIGNSTNVQAQNCVALATSTGFDDDPTVATITDFSCAGVAPIIGITIDANIFSASGTNWCTDGWYSFDLIVNGNTILTDQCSLTAYDLTSLLPITSISISSNDSDNWSDG